ncbi:hypothetical protein JL722_4386 [Aureococcus anophagefferens]|nr:hypothetical protein JL722_4386 [Aureococcus anophagefferens]
MKHLLLVLLSLRAAGDAIYRVDSREVCVETGAAPFCVDFVHAELEAAARAFCESTQVCVAGEAASLAAEARRALLARGDAAEAELRRRFRCMLDRNATDGCQHGEDQTHDWLDNADGTARRKIATRRREAAALLAGDLPRPELGLFSEDEHYEHATAALLRSLELGLAALDPGRACMVDLHVATIAGAWGELDAAARVYGRAAARAAVLSEGARLDGRENDFRDYGAMATASRLNAAMLLPPIVPRSAELAAARARLRGDLEILAAADFSPVREDLFLQRIGRTLFYLAHQCEPEVEEQKLLAALLAKVAPSLVEASPELARRRPAAATRVAFVSAYLCDHSIGKMLAEVLFFLNQDARLQVFALHLENGHAARPGDHVRQFLEAHLGADRSLVLPATLAGARGAVLDLGVDVLLYPDVGMEITSYFLAFSRLARVQVVWWGHPVTTGLASVDYFLGLDTEVDGASDHYAEQLVHALFDDILLDVLEADPTGVVAVVSEPQRQLTSLMFRRLRASAAARNRAHLLERLRVVDYWNYVNALSNARVALDTYPYGGCLTALDALSNGVPLVVLPGPLERGRHAMSIYGQMNLTDFVARDAADYVRLAVALATDDDVHARAVGEIRAKYPDAHRAGDVAAEWAGAFLRMDRGAV